MKDYLTRVETVLKDALDRFGARPAALKDAIRWAIEGGGKRLRPQICFAAAEAVGGHAEDATAPACAIELLHSYTLVHDDLPAMDNDTIRRGKASVWARFGEADAILAGDALQAAAFAELARTPEKTPGTLAKILEVFGSCAVGVVQGQVEDVAGAAMTEDTIEFVFARKTAGLFVAAACCGALAGGGTDAQTACLRTFAENLGFAFQYEDDLLDGDDGAFSSLAILGKEEVLRRIGRHTDTAVAALNGLPGDTAFLSGLAHSLVTRSV